MRVKVESEKAGLKLNIKKMKIIASGPIIASCRRGKVETVTYFVFLDSKFTTDSDYSHEIKRYLLLGRKLMTNLDCVLKSTDITSPTKGCVIKTLVFPILRYRCESWTIKKAEP